METHIEMYNVRRLIQKVQCMETNIEVTMYGDSYRVYNVWRIIYRVQCFETHIEFKMYGCSYRV